MKRIGILLTLITLVLWLLASSAEAHGGKKKNKNPPAKKIEIKCPPVLNDINDCLDTGCGKSLTRCKSAKELDGRRS